MHRVQYRYIHRAQVPKHTQAHQAHRLGRGARAGLQAFRQAIKLPRYLDGPEVACLANRSAWVRYPVIAYLPVRYMHGGVTQCALYPGTKVPRHGVRGG